MTWKGDISRKEEALQKEDTSREEGILQKEDMPGKEKIVEEDISGKGKIVQKEDTPGKEKISCEDAFRKEETPGKKDISRKEEAPGKKNISRKEDISGKKNVPRKDIPEKILLSHGDVFADCENVFAYGGERRLRGEDLHPAPTESFYRGADGMHNQFCDVSSYLVRDGQIQIQFIIGNETGLEGRQVLRKASYQGGAYRAQLESGQPVYPVIGMVIDWTRKGTKIPLSLHELLLREGVSGEVLSRVDDVKLEVYHMNNLSREVRSRFVSDLGFVADFLNEGGFESRREQKIVHPEALCEMMRELTGDTRFTDLVEDLLKRQAEGKEIIMCEYIDMLEARGEARGIEIGEAAGEARGIKIGEATGEATGENRMAKLMQRLLRDKNYGELEAMSNSREKRHELYRKYGI